MELISTRIPSRTNQTYIEHVKDSEKFLIPGNNLVLITLREDEPEDRAPFAPPIDLPLHLGHGSATNHHR
jgi:hypothetical protein